MTKKERLEKLIALRQEYDQMEKQKRNSEKRLDAIEKESYDLISGSDLKLGTRYVVNGKGCHVNINASRGMGGTGWLLTEETEIVE